MNPAGGTIEGASNQHPTVTINGSLSGSGPLQIGSTGNSNETNGVFTGANTNFTGTIYGGYDAVLTFDGLNATGAGPVVADDVYGAGRLNFLSNTGGTLAASSVTFDGTIEVDPVTSGSGQTLMLKQATVSGSPTFTSNNSYILSIGTLTSSGFNLSPKLTPNGATVSIGTFINSAGQSYLPLGLQGTSGGTIGSVSIPGGNNDVPYTTNVQVYSGNWTITGSSNYSIGTALTGGTLTILADNSLGTVPATPGTASSINNIWINGGMLSAGSSFTLNANRSILIGSTTGSTGGTGYIGAAAGQTLTFNGLVAGAGNSGTNQLVVAGSGIVVLGGTNTCNGGTTISGGGLVISATSALPASGGITVNSGAAVGGSGAPSGSGSVNAWLASNTINVASTGAVGITANSSETVNFTSTYPGVGLGSIGNNTFSGTITPANQTYRLGGGVGTLTVSTALADYNSTATTLVVSGSVALAGANAYSSGTTLAGGVLQLAASQAATSGPLGNVGNGSSITFAGGTLQFSAVNQYDYSGLIANSTAPIILDTNGQNVTFAGAISSSNTGGLTLNDSSATPGALILTASNAFSGATTISRGTLQLGNGTSGEDGSIGSGAPSGSGVTDNAALVYNLYGRQAAAYAIGGNGSVTKLGGGTLTVSGSNTFSGPLSVLNGTLSSGTINNAGSNGPLGNSAWPVVLGGSGGAPSGSSTLEYTGGSASSNKSFTMGGGTGSFQVDNAAATLTLTGTIGGGGSLAKTGPGMLTLTPSGANTWGGGTSVSGGTLQLGNAAALPSGAAPGPLTVTSATLDLNGQSPTVGALTGNSGALITSSSANTPTTLTVNTATSSTFAGTINNPGPSISLVKAGSGTLALTRTSSYTGTTSINQGTLVIASIANVNAGTNTSLGNPASGNGTINMGSAGLATLQFIGTNGGSGGGSNRPINLSGNAVLDASGTPAGGNTLNLSGGVTGNNVTLTLTGTDAVGGEMGGQINLQGNSAVIKSGPGAWTMDMANSYSGGTTLNQGTLYVQNWGSGSALGSGTVTLNGGTLAASSVASGSVLGTVTGLVQAGSGAHTIAPDGFSGSMGTLSLNGGLATNANTTLAYNLNLDVSTGSSGANGERIYRGDLILIGGGLTVGANTDLSIGSLSPAATGDYRLMGGTLGTPTLTNFTLPPAPVGDTISLSTTADSGYLDLVVAQSNFFTNPSFTLSASAAAARIITGGTSSIAITLGNSGGGVQPDTVLYNGLSASTGAGGTISGTSGSGSVAYGNSGSYAANFTSSTTGSYTISPTVASFSGSNGTTPVWSGTSTTTVTVLGHAAPVYTPATLDLGNVHAGYTAPITSAASINVTNGVLGDARADLYGSGSGTSGVSLTSLGSVSSGIAAGSSGTLGAVLRSARPGARSSTRR